MNLAFVDLIMLMLILVIYVRGTASYSPLTVDSLYFSEEEYLEESLPEGSELDSDPIADTTAPVQ